MGVTWSDRAAARCMCGRRKTVNIVIEFIRDGQLDYAGGRFCYDHGTQVCFAVPAGAALTEVRIYDWREPGELIKVTASQVPEQERAVLP